MERKEFVEKYLKDAFDSRKKFRDKLHHLGMLIKKGRDKLIKEISRDLDDNFREEMINAARKSGFPGMRRREEFFDAFAKELSNLTLSIQNKPKSDIRRKFAEKAAKRKVDWKEADNIIRRRPRKFPLLRIMMRLGRF